MVERAIPDSDRDWPSDANGAVVSRAALAAAAVAWRRMRRPLFLVGLYLGDIITPSAAFVAAYYLRFSAVPHAVPLTEALEQPGNQLVLLAVTLVHVLMLRQAGFYRLHRVWLTLDMAFQVLLVCGASALLFFALTRLHHSNLGSRILLLYLWILLTIITFALKLSARTIVLLMLCVGVGIKRAVIVGSTETAQRLQRTLDQNPHLGYQVIGLLFRGESNAYAEPARRHTVHRGSASRVQRALLDINPDVVMVATPAHKNTELLDLIATCTRQGIEVRLVPEYYELYARRLLVDRIGVTPLIHLRRPRAPIVLSAVKRAADLALAVALMPALALLLLVLRGRSRRLDAPLLVTQRRAGRDGRPISLVRLNPALFTADAPLCMLVLPEIINVLRGEMSFVGPRSSDPGRVHLLSSWEKRKLVARPGIVGGAPSNEDVPGEAAADQHTWDVTYLDQMSVAFDLSVLISALPRLLTTRVRVGATEE